MREPGSVSEGRLMRTPGRAACGDAYSPFFLWDLSVAAFSPVIENV